MKLLGIPVKVELSFFIISLFLGAGRGWNLTFLIEWVAVVFISVLIHEMGHALTARAFGLNPEVTLYAMGGLTTWRESKKISPGRSIAISLAGPGAGFLTGALVLLLMSSQFGRVGPEPTLTTMIIRDLLWVNLGWGIFNLIPVLPLDGGNVATSVSELILRRRSSAETASRVISVVTAVAVFIWALSIGWTWVMLMSAWFCWINGQWLYQQIQRRRDVPLRRTLRQAGKALARKDGATAVRLADQALRQARTSATKNSALILLANGQILTRDFDGARQTLDRLRALFGQTDDLEGLLMIRRGEIEQGASFLERSFASHPNSWSGIHLVEALIKLRKFDRALEIVEHPELKRNAHQLGLDIEAAAFEAGQYGASVRAGAFVFLLVGDPNAAYNVACAFARENRFEEGIEWLERAVKAGFDNFELLATDPDIEALRTAPAFQSICREPNPTPG
jgi:Zn-dependent protease